MTPAVATTDPDPARPPVPAEAPSLLTLSFAWRIQGHALASLAWIISPHAGRASWTATDHAGAVVRSGDTDASIVTEVAPEGTYFHADAPPILRATFQHRGGAWVLRFASSSLLDQFGVPGGRTSVPELLSRPAV
ncbi:MAG: hypothetical protein HRU70_08485 [Phycisphaeraceae bacterium]|nr:MAG: hypothetical protein HRU70_08485 [Phycisphaeraceae bacterium]